MRYRLMAAYRGAPYQVGLGPGGAEATLFAACPPPPRLGFRSAAGHWRKQVSIGELDALWQSRPVGEYRGEPCLVLDDLGDRLHIVYLGRDAAQARQLGYWEIDREVFEVMVPRQEVTGLGEEVVEIPLTAATFPAPAATSPAPAATFPAPAAASPAPASAAPWPPGQVAAWHGSPAPESWPAPGTGAGPRPGSFPAAGADPPRGRRAARRERISAQAIFADLLDQAAIPRNSYAVDADVPGAMCLVKADGGYEVFSSTGDARLEVRFFEDEEAAYFYLFGILAAEAVRSGLLGPTRPNGHRHGSRGPAGPRAPAGDVSKLLRRGKLPNQPSGPDRVNEPAGLTVPRSPSSPVGPFSIGGSPARTKTSVPSRINPVSSLNAVNSSLR
jgi:hypothetical protein